MRDTAIVEHRNFAIEHDLVCLPGPCRGAIHQDSAAQQHGATCAFPAAFSLVRYDVDVGCVRKRLAQSKPHHRDLPPLG